MEFPQGLMFTREHEWIRDDGGDEFTTGITEHAAEQMGDITYVELPEVGMDVDKAQPVGTVESVKAASDVYAPISGCVSAINEELEANPELVNQDPYGQGWLYKLKEGNMREFDKLMDKDAYARFVEELDE